MRKHHLVLVAILVAETIFFAAISGPSFDSVAEAVNYTSSYFADLVAQAAPEFFLAFGMTLVLMTAGIDLSVGSLVALVASTMALFSGGSDFWWSALPLGLVVAVSLGGANGVLVSVFDIPPIIATLGTMIFFRGWCFFILGDLERAPFVDVPGYGVLGEFNCVLPMLAVLYGVGGVWFYRSRWRREIVFVGGHRVAAHYAGVRVGRILVSVYLLMGVLAFLAAVTFTARNGSVSGSALTGLELKVIVAVVLGGTRVQGGHGSLFGSFLGVLVIAVLEEGLRSSAAWGESHLPFKLSHLEYILLGLLLIVGVRWSMRRRD